MGLKINIRLIKHGFYPKGGGIVEITLEPSKLQSISYEKFGNIEEIYCEAYSEGLPEHVTSREINEALNILASYNIPKELIKFNKKYISLEESKGNIGNFFFIMAKGSNNSVLGYDSIGLKGVPAEKVAKEPVQSILENIFETNAPLDIFAGDQVLVWASIAQGTSILRTHKLTLHAFTTLHILKEILEVEYNIEGRLNEVSRIIIKGKNI